VVVRVRWSRTARLRRDLGGEWFLDAASLLVIIPPAILASVAELAESNVASRLGWTLANLLAFLPCVVIAALLVRITRERRRREPLPIPVTFLAGAAFGVVKVLGTSWIGTALGLTSMGLGTITGRVVQGTLVGILAVPAVVLTRATLARHQMEHRLLVSETFAALLPQAQGSDSDVSRSATLARDLGADRGEPVEDGSAARDEAAVVLRDLRDALSDVAPSRAPALITASIEHHLRPLTHRLWSGASMPASDLTLIGLVRAMLRRPLYPVLIPAFVHGAVVTLFALNRVPPTRAVATGTAAAAALAALLVLARVSRPRIASPAAGAAHLALALFAAAAATTLIRTLLAPDFDLPLSALAAFVVAWTIPLIVISNIVATAVHDRDSVRAQLIRAIGPEWYAQLMRAHVDAAAARDIANRLHGDLQGELLVSAARIGRLGHDDQAIRAELDRIIERIDRAMLARPSTVTPPLGDRLVDLGSRWAGLLDVRVQLDIADPLGTRFDDLVVGIVSEALTNARRHGMARDVQVWVVDASDARRGVRVVVEDDGIGPGAGDAGIGSAHLDAVAPGNWSRVARMQGGTRLEVAVAGDRVGLRVAERSEATARIGTL